MCGTNDFTSSSISCMIALPVITHAPLFARKTFLSINKHFLNSFFEAWIVAASSHADDD